MHSCDMRKYSLEKIPLLFSSHVSILFPLWCLPSPNPDHLSCSVCLGQVFIYLFQPLTYIQMQILRDNNTENKENPFFFRPSQKAWASKLKFAGLLFDQAKPEWVGLYGPFSSEVYDSIILNKPINLHNEIPLKKCINLQRKRSKEID